MDPKLRRILIPIVVGAIALAIVIVVSTGGGNQSPPPSDGPGSPSGPAATSTEDTATGESATGDEAASAETVPAERVTYESLRAATATATDPNPIGSLVPTVDDMEVLFTRRGAGIERIAFADIWETARAWHIAEDFWAENGEDAPLDQMPAEAEDLRYILVTEQPFVNATRNEIAPVFGAVSVIVNGTQVLLNTPDAWSVAGDADSTTARTFQATIESDDGPVLLIERTFRREANYGLRLDQRFTNLTDTPIDVTWWSFGPSELHVDRAAYMDRRRARFGFIENGMNRSEEYLLERTDLDSLDEVQLWPNEYSTKQGHILSWFGMTNRYFALTILPADVTPGSPTPLTNVATISHDRDYEGDEVRSVVTFLESPVIVVDAGETKSLDLGIYAGPQDRLILKSDEPYVSIGMGELILYQMSSWCAMCTFQWLAKLLLGFLAILSSKIVFDWGLAIICLVICVRILLHPITKKSQIGMQRFGKQMQELKPKMDKLQQRYANDKQKLQQEQLALFREHGVNPFQMLGCLPMFLQTPIWIALYAMLYFAFDLRQQPAFFGIFQTLTDGSWQFLADLSSADHFFWTFEAPTQFLWINLTGINLLPFLMGALFFFQQKYMSPPPSPTMSEDQLRQQKIMKVLMVVMFPVMLYGAPSGLTLYILTSSTIGIIESRYIRRHITDDDLAPKKPKALPKGKVPRDAMGRAQQRRMKYLEEKKRERKGGGKRFKKR